MNQRPAALPILAISLNAMLWGLSWWPLHQLRDRGVHGLWTTFLSYALAVVLVLAWRPAALQQLARDKRLWLLMATTLNHCLAWTAQPWWRGSLLGALGAPLSYYGGAQIAGVGLPYGTWPSLLLLAAIWAVVMPVLHGFARLYRAQYEHSQQARQSA